MKIIGANITGSFILNNQDVTNTLQSSSVWSGSVAAQINSLNAASASLNSATASLNSATASLYAATASLNSATASLNTFTASAATTGSNTFNGNQIVSGSLTVTGSITTPGTLTAQTLIVQTITSSQDFVTGSTKFGSIISNTHQFTGSISVSGSVAVNDSNVILTNQTSSMSVATASFVANAQTASYVENAQTASFVTLAQTASFVANAQSASNAVNAQTASLAQTASFVSLAQTASYVENAQTASFVITAQTASFVTLAQTASFVANAQTASYVENAQTASFVTTAQTASFVTLAQTASFVANAQSASNAVNAATASFVTLSQTASFVTLAQTASFITTAQTASFVTLAQTASFVTLAQTASFVANAQTASYVENAQTASFVTTAQTASFVTLAQTASFVTTAQTASFVANAQSASNAVAAQTASFANSFTVANTLTAQTLVVQTITSSVDFVTGSTRFGSTGSNTHLFTGSVNITGSLTVTTTGTELQVGATGVNLGNALTDSHIISGSLTVNPGGLFVSSSGNIGMGTTNPSYRLHISGAFSSNPGLYVYGTTYGMVGVDRGSSASSAGVNYYTTGSQRWFTGIYENTNNFGFYNALSANFPMVITTGSNVGIGTTSPNSILDVRMSSAQGVLIGGGATTASLQHGIDGNSRYLMISGPSGGANNNYGAVWVVNNTTESTGALMGGYFFGQLVSGKSGTNAGSKAAISGFTTGSGGSVGGFGGELRFYTKPNNAANDIGQYERMRITMDGIVGIGTTSPSEPLSVSYAAHGLISQHRQSSGVGVGQNFYMKFNTANGTAANYAGIYAEIISNTDAAQSGRMILQVANAGSLLSAVTISNSGDLSMAGTGATKLQSGTTAQRPSAAAGLIRYNTSLAELEMSNGSNWGSLQTKVMLGSSPSNPAESANDIKTYYPNATNGFYWIRQTGSTATSAYCVFRDATGAEIAGGPWTVPIISNDANSNFSGNGVSAASTFLSKCQAIGINTPGRGMESSRTTTEVYGAWLAVKRTIWEAYTPFVANGNTSGGSVLRMPMININGEGGASAHRLIYNTSLSTHIPPNESGDRCDASQLFCGWWSATDISGWRTNDNNVPGPEDWGPSDNSNTAYNGAGVQSTLTVCVYK